jgi:hypothetical protein
MTTTGPDSPATTAVDKPLRIFISYRRAGRGGYVGRLTDRLVAAYGEGNVFRDVDSLRTGESFEQRIGSQLSQATLVIAAIEGNWVGRRLFRRSRLQTEGDWVRKELEHALVNKIPVIPVLIGETPVPAGGDLPGSLRGLLAVHASRVRDESWPSDTARLVEAIEAITHRASHEGDELPFVWRSPQIAKASPLRRWPLVIAALAVVALVIGLVVVPPQTPNLEDPTTWPPPPRSAARSDVSYNALILALSELQTGTREAAGENTGYNVSKFTERFKMGSIPWSVAFVTWCYLHALGRVRDGPAESLPFADTPSAQNLANSLRKGGWLIEPFNGADAKPGDILFFRRGPNIGHAEIIYNVVGDKVCSVGGNVTNRVVGRCTATSDDRLAGLGAVPQEAFSQ